ncbi:MAG: FAD:protein FMN transferase [Calditrichaeota bacterium]|nr:MAG: FAD:protein FMN transferase [Calditrichota bacterium]MBL1206097.1 FAD:protein FMN transferase [Calditrichota bacterium]NOG45923.1 FAD:protein FMN transferase [Calditrichota bacterium]
MKYYLFIIFSVFLCSCIQQQENIEIYGETMGTTYSVKIVGLNKGESAKEILKTQINSILQEVNRQMSTYIPESEISVFNKSTADNSQSVSEHFLEVLNLAKQISVESDGAFDVTVGPVVDLWGFGKKEDRENPPSDEEVNIVKSYVGMDKIEISGNTILKKHDKTALDFSAIAKGFGVDVVAGLLEEKGYKNFLVEIGGEVVVKGKKGNDPWRIGVDQPLIEPTVNRNFEAILQISDVAVATSGDYRNYFVSGDSLYTHTIDPVTARPIVNGVASVTVIAPNCTLADAMATAIMVMGEEKGLQWVESKPGIETMIIVRKSDGFKVISSSGFEAFVDK